MFTGINTTQKKAKVKIVLIVAITVMLGLLLQSCGGGGGGTTTAAVPDSIVADVEQNGVIAGVLESTMVVSAQSVGARSAGRHGFVGAKVCAFEEGTPEESLVPSGSSLCATTAADGAYVIEKVRHGRYMLVVDADGDGVGDGLISNVAVEKGSVCNLGSKRVDEMEPMPVKKHNPVNPVDTTHPEQPVDDPAENVQPEPKDNKGHDKHTYNCNLALDKVNYGSGETLVISVRGYNGTATPVKCGVRINLKKGAGHPEMWRSDFADSQYFITLTPGAETIGEIRKIISEEWANTNSMNGSDYHIYPIGDNGAIIGKGDNFNILHKKNCNNDKKCHVDEHCDNNDGTDPADDPATDPGTGDSGGITPPPPPPPAPIVCNADIDCNDFSEYTNDLCRNPGTPESYCEWMDF